MNTITIDTKLYEDVEAFARRHNVSVRELVETYFQNLIHGGRKESGRMKKVEDLSPGVRRLIGIVSADEEDCDDLNGDKYRYEYLKEKHAL